jgi:hypothetical protein
MLSTTNNELASSKLSIKRYEVVESYLQAFCDLKRLFR